MSEHVQLMAPGRGFVSLHGGPDPDMHSKIIDALVHGSAEVIPEADRTEKVSIRNLDFFYGGLQALFGVTMPIYDRSVTALMGPSGCGKSTLLRVLNRIYQMYPGQRAAGEVMMDGMNILDPALDLNVLRRRIGMIFQKPSPLPMSIYENVAFGLKLAGGMSRGERDAGVERALRRAALWDEVKDTLESPGTSLSGGQQQRLCIARAVAAEPEVLLMDEPCSSLDPLSTMRIEQLMDDLRRDFCIVIVTHNLQQAARVSQYTGFMYLGKLIEFDCTTNVFTQPREKQTDDFVTGRFG